MAATLNQLYQKPQPRYSWRRRDEEDDAERIAITTYRSLLLGLFFWPHGDQRATLPTAPVGYEAPLTAPADGQDGLDLRATGDELPEQEF